MTLEFDNNGFLTPHGPIEANLEILENSFTFNQHRRNIFEEYVAYTKELQRYASSTLDCYFVIVYPENHPKHNIFRMDFTEWHYLFSRTRRDKKTGKINNKGFLQLNF